MSRTIIVVEDCGYEAAALLEREGFDVVEVQACEAHPRETLRPALLGEPKEVVEQDRDEARRMLDNIRREMR